MNLDQIVTKKDLLELEDRLFLRLKEITVKKAPPKYLRTKEICELLKISPSTLQNLRNSKSIPFTKVGGILLYDFDEVQLAFLIQAEEKNYASGN